jgi:hypothetical protein
MRRIEVLDRRKLQAFGVDCSFQVAQFFIGPQLPPIVADPPVLRAVGFRDFDAATKVVDPMRHDVRRPSLLGEAEVFGREHVAVKAKAEFHGFVLSESVAGKRGP